LLGLPVYAQNRLFQYFNDICDELVKQAKIDGTFDMGILGIIFFMKFHAINF
jgi:ABC-type glycerol-3-phosphate transport system permease component